MAAFDDPRLDRIAAAIRTIPNFPKPGIMFYDICSLLLLPDVFQLCIDVLVERYQGRDVDVVAGAMGCDCLGP
jgi:adenine phosphoribosyltransferase